MKCMNCGADVPEDNLKCPYCGQDIQIVPDYNPLDDVLAAQVKGEVYKTLSGTTRREQSNNDYSDSSSYRKHSVSEETVDPRQEERRRRRQLEKKRQLMKRKKQRAMIIAAAAAVLLILIGVTGYRSSYTGIIKQGQKYLSSGEYDSAEKKFRKAIRKNDSRIEGYQGMAELLLKQNKVDKAEKIYLNAISDHDDNLALYNALISFYIDTNQENKISILIDNCENQKILEELGNYVSVGPEFKLDSNKVYDEIQILEITSDGEEIYYTLDGSEPTDHSQKYTKPIELAEGTTIVKAISVNSDGIPSLTVTKSYTIKFPIADAPTVTPTTGQYEEPQKITVDVPDGYKAYSTMDGSIPNPGKSGTKLYNGPIDMPEGNTVFTAVLIDSKQRVSDMTKRNYELIISE